MELLIIIVFLVGYTAIALEHQIDVNKTASALLAGVLCWTLFTLAGPLDKVVQGEEFQHFLAQLKLKLSPEKYLELSLHDQYQAFIESSLAHHLAEISQILFFLLGAMTIVELVDAYQGFKLITDRIKTRNPVKLLWFISWLTFFLSAILDNLTSSIVMASLIRKLIPDKKARLLFAGMVVISANAGGAWSPIGDVTTTMLWIGGRISAIGIMQDLLTTSMVCLLVPLIYLSVVMKKDSIQNKSFQSNEDDEQEPVRGSTVMLIVGIGALMSVPVFKMVTHLPPYMGMMLGLGVLWVVSEMINPHADEMEGKPYTVIHALSRIDSSSVLFFLGILLAVSSLESNMTLHHMASWLDQSIGNQTIIITIIGLLSAIVDNVPLVAASMGMYSIETFPMDHFMWKYMAYCAGTGGSVLIIGSAAGVAVMGIEKIDFIWYAKRMAFLALLGYIAGCLYYVYVASA